MEAAVTPPPAADTPDDEKDDAPARPDADCESGGFKWWHAGVAVLLVGVAAGLFYLLPVAVWLKVAIEWIDGLGWIGPAVFVGLYAVAVMLGTPSTPLNIGAGLLFGVFVGTLAAAAGAVLGGVAAFFLARYFLGDWVQAKLECYPQSERVLEACEREPWKFLILLRAHPVLPSALKNYGLGTTEVRWWIFAICTLLAGLPIRITYAFLGSAGYLSLTGGKGVSTAEWVLYGVGFVAAVVLTVGLTWFAWRQLKEVEQT